MQRRNERPVRVSRNPRIEAPARRALIVLGMHRSGTSLTAATLCAAGADPPKNVSGLAWADEDNARGYWEPLSLPILHDELLREMGVSWSTPLSYPQGFFRSPKAAGFRERALELLRDEYGHSRLLCLKDPRLCRLLPLWKPLFAMEGIEPSYIHVTRHPLEVALSLAKRNGLHRSESLMAWLRHVLEAEAGTRGQKRVFITYDRALADWHATLQHVGDALEIAWPRRMADIDVDVNSILSQDLRHHRLGMADLAVNDQNTAWIADVYSACVAAAEGNESQQLAVFDRVRGELEQADKAFEPLLALARRDSTAAYDELRRGADEAAKAAAEIEERRVAELESALASTSSEIGAARDELTQRGEESAQLAESLREREARLSALEAELASARTELAAREADFAATQSTAEAARNESTQRGEESARLAEALSERDAHLSALEAELASARTELIAREADSAAWQSAAEAARNEVALRDEESVRLAEVLSERDARLSAFEEELASARTELAAREADFAASQSTAEAARNELTQRGEESAQLAESLRERDARLGTLEAELAFARTELAAREADVAASQSAAAAARDEASRDLDRMRGMLEAREREATESRQAFLDQTRNTRKEIAAARGESSRLAAELRDVRSALRSSEDGVAALSAKVAHLNAARVLDVEERADQHGAAQQELEALRASLEHRERRIEALQRDLHAAHSVEGDARKQDDGERNALSEAKAQCRALQADLEFARAALTESEMRLAAQPTQETRPLRRQAPDRVRPERARPTQSARNTASHGAFFASALRKRGGEGDYVWLGVIDFDFRIQRPQHLAMEIAEAGNRVFYLSTKFEPIRDDVHFRIDSMPHPNVFILQLCVEEPVPPNIYGGFSVEQVAAIAKSLDAAFRALDVREPAVVVQYPSWHYVAAGIPGATVVHDCLDYVGGFSNVPSEMVELEAELIRHADLVVTSSEHLAEHVREVRDTVIVRNAADIALFARAADVERNGSESRPVVGYFGAIAEWYETEWIEQCATSRPDWDFVLIGSAFGADTSRLSTMPNVRLAGEQPYLELPTFLATFDVAVIPFKINDLIRCTNPVKLYEYMAAGKPVVASPIPEVMRETSLAYIAADASEFERQIEKARSEDSDALRRKRRDWAAEHTWRQRAGDFAAAVARARPRVSVIVLAYNHWELTEACLQSVLAVSDYANLEVLVVDNASSDETPQRLRELAELDERVSVIRNETNLGFAAGNNVGIRAATGEYVILLNNDTYVTKGWVRDLIRPLILDRQVGLAGPLTNNIGNEQKISLAYPNLDSIEAEVRPFLRKRLRERFDTHNLAFFCVAVRRDVVDTVGLLDEAYGLGFFEDDDYCRRVLAAGYRIVVTDDAFVHHHLSGSFNALGAGEKQAQMERNKAIFESRWGEWQPHAYRDSPGFG
jgi:GT2 family glycosyltransferase/glycosyltransferase involved in cell wall biosynthesis